MVGLFLAIGTGCGPGGLGAYCSASSECEEGLECVPYQSLEITNGGLECVSQPLCSIPCETDEDCTSVLGEGHICQDSCGTGACLEGSSG